MTCNSLYETEVKELEGRAGGRPADGTRKATAFDFAVQEAEFLIDGAKEFAIPTDADKGTLRQLRDILESSLSRDRLNEIYVLAESLRKSVMANFSVKDLVPTISSRDVPGSVFARSYYDL